MHELKDKAIKTAAKFLTQRGYEAIENNRKPKSGSFVDVVAQEYDTVAFVDAYARHSIDKKSPKAAARRRARNAKSRQPCRPSTTTKATSTSPSIPMGP